MDSITQSVVAVMGSDGRRIGSGFFVLPNLVLTCHHVVYDATGTTFPEGVRLQVPDQSIVSAKCTSSEDLAALDCCLLELDSPLPDSKPLPMASKLAKGHSEFTLYGYPNLGIRNNTAIPLDGWLGGEIQFEYTHRGRFGSKNYQIRGFVVEHSTVVGGSSGGPIFDRGSNAVIGMIAAKTVGDGSPGALSGFCIDLKKVALQSEQLASVLAENTSTVPAFGDYLNAAGTKVIANKITKRQLSEFKKQLEVDAESAVRRKNASTSMQAFTHSEDRILLLHGPSGFGKTTFVRSLAYDRLALDQPTLLFRAKDCHEPDRGLIQTILTDELEALELRTDATTFLPSFQSLPDNLVIIDAINEIQDDPSTFYKALSRLCRTRTGLKFLIVTQPSLTKDCLRSCREYGVLLHDIGRVQDAERQEFASFFGLSVDAGQLDVFQTPEAFSRAARGGTPILSSTLALGQFGNDLLTWLVQSSPDRYLTEDYAKSLFEEWGISAWTTVSISVDWKRYESDGPYREMMRLVQDRGYAEQTAPDGSNSLQSISLDQDFHRFIRFFSLSFLSPEQLSSTLFDSASDDLLHLYMQDHSFNFQGFCEAIQRMQETWLHRIPYSVYERTFSLLADIQELANREYTPAEDMLHEQIPLFLDYLCTRDGTDNSGHPFRCKDWEDESRQFQRSLYGPPREFLRLCFAYPSQIIPILMTFSTDRREIGNEATVASAVNGYLFQLTSSSPEVIVKHFFQSAPSSVSYFVQRYPAQTLQQINAWRTTDPELYEKTMHTYPWSIAQFYANTDSEEAFGELCLESLDRLRSEKRTSLELLLGLAQLPSIRSIVLQELFENAKTTYQCIHGLTHFISDAWDEIYEPCLSIIPEAPPDALPSWAIFAGIAYQKGIRWNHCLEIIRLTLHHTVRSEYGKEYLGRVLIEVESLLYKVNEEQAIDLYRVLSVAISQLSDVSQLGGIRYLITASKHRGDAYRELLKAFFELKSEDVTLTVVSRCLSYSKTFKSGLEDIESLYETVSVEDAEEAILSSFEIPESAHNEYAEGFRSMEYFSSWASGSPLKVEGKKLRLLRTIVGEGHPISGTYFDGNRMRRYFHYRDDRFGEDETCKDLERPSEEWPDAKISDVFPDQDLCGKPAYLECTWIYESGSAICEVVLAVAPFSVSFVERQYIELL